MLHALNMVLGRGILSSLWVQVLLIFVVMFVFELVFYIIPGISLTTLLIGIGALELGFVPILFAGFAVILAHLIIRRDFTLIAPDLVVLVPMVAFAALYGPMIVDFAGLAVFGFLLAAVKWGVALFAAMLFGKNMPKRVLNIVLEPPISALLFWNFTFLVAWLF